MKDIILKHNFIEIPLKIWETVFFAPIYFFLSLINLHLKLRITPIWGDGSLLNDHDMFIRFIGTNNEQSRILQFMIPEVIHRIIGVSVENAYMIQRLGFVFLTFCCFHVYLRKWFNLAGAFSGVVFLSSIMPLTYMNHLQESSPLLLLTFLLSLWAIRERKTVLLMVVFTVGAFNNETLLILPLAYFLNNYNRTDLHGLIKLIWKTFLVSLPLIIIIGTIRYITRNNPPLAPLWQFSNNISNFYMGFKSGVLSASNFIFYLFNLLWIYAFLGFKKKRQGLGQGDVFRIDGGDRVYALPQILAELHGKFGHPSEMLQNVPHVLILKVHGHRLSELGLQRPSLIQDDPLVHWHR